MKDILITITVFILIGCSQKSEYSKQSDSKLKATNSLQYSIYLEIIDDCEYLVMDGSYAVGIIHKANCKNHKQ